MNFFKIVIIFVCLFCSINIYGQSKSKKILEKKKEQKAQETIKLYHKAVDTQHDIQSRDTKKRMKASLKKSINHKSIKIKKKKKKKR